MKNAAKRLEHVRTVNEKYNVLNRWEAGFLESISNQFSKRGTLTPDQCKVFAKAYRLGMTPMAPKSTKLLRFVRNITSPLVTLHHWPGECLMTLNTS